MVVSKLLMLKILKILTNIRMQPIENENNEMKQYWLPHT